MNLSPVTKEQLRPKSVQQQKCLEISVRIRVLPRTEGLSLSERRVDILTSEVQLKQYMKRNKNLLANPQLSL